VTGAAVVPRPMMRHSRCASASACKFRRSGGRRRPASTRPLRRWEDPPIRSRQRVQVLSGAPRFPVSRTLRGRGGRTISRRTRCPGAHAVRRSGSSRLWTVGTGPGQAAIASSSTSTSAAARSRPLATSRHVASAARPRSGRLRFVGHRENEPADPLTPSLLDRRLALGCAPLVLVASGPPRDARVDLGRGTRRGGAQDAVNRASCPLVGGDFTRLKDDPAPGACPVVLHVPLTHVDDSAGAVESETARRLHRSPVFPHRPE
jgi:hypothetical protein